MSDVVDGDILEVVARTIDLPDHGFRRGQVGTVVEALTPGIVEVEFSDDDGRATAFAPVEMTHLHVLRRTAVSAISRT